MHFMGATSHNMARYHWKVGFQASIRFIKEGAHSKLWCMYPCMHAKFVAMHASIPIDREHNWYIIACSMHIITSTWWLIAAHIHDDCSMHTYVPVHGHLQHAHNHTPFYLLDSAYKCVGRTLACTWLQYAHIRTSTWLQHTHNHTHCWYMIQWLQKYICTGARFQYAHICSYW